MLSNFSIDYTVFPQHSNRVMTHRTDDPIEAEEFLMHLLAAKARILEIRHSGAALTKIQFDRMVGVAAERIVSMLLREALGIDAPEAVHRFGFAA